MPKRIVLQAGHLNCKNNSIVSLRTSTGAPGEMAFNEDMVNRVYELFKKIPEIEITRTDANANDNNNLLKVDWDAFISFHYDADIYNDSGGFVDFPEPSTDGATKESQRIANIIGQVYFTKSGVKQVQKRSNANTRYYYMWQYLSSKTPCIILELGVGWRKPNDFESLNTEDGRTKTALILTEAICKAFDVPFKVEDGGNISQDIIQKAGYYTEVRNIIGVNEDKFSEVSKRLQDLLISESDYINRLEQVRRLEGQIDLLNEQIKVLGNTPSEDRKTIQELNANITKLHEAMNQLGRDKGGLNDQITKLKAELKSCQNLTPEDDCIEKFIKIISDLFKGGAK